MLSLYEEYKYPIDKNLKELIFEKMNTNNIRIINFQALMYITKVIKEYLSE